MLSDKDVSEQHKNKCDMGHKDEAPFDERSIRLDVRPKIGIADRIYGKCHRVGSWALVAPPPQRANRHAEPSVPARGNLPLQFGPR